MSGGSQNQVAPTHGIFAQYRRIDSSVREAIGGAANQRAVRVFCERQMPAFLGRDPADLPAQITRLPSRLFLVGRVQAEAYLLAVFLEDGIVDSRCVGAAQVVPDVVQRLFPDAAFGGSGLHGRLYSDDRLGRSGRG